MVIDVLTLIVSFFVFGYLLCQVASLLRWRGAWRMASAVPAVAIAAVSVKILYEVGVDLDAHKLWPIEAMLWSAAGLAVLSTLYLGRGLVQLGRSRRAGKTGQSVASAPGHGAELEADAACVALKSPGDELRF